MHLGFWQQVVSDLLGSDWGRFAYTLIDSQFVGDRLIGKVQSASPDVPLTEYPERTQGIGYYRTAAFKIMANADGDELEIGDGGFPPDAVLTVKIDAAHTDDHYELFELDAPRGPTTPLHRTGWAKAYYVLSGRKRGQHIPGAVAESVPPLVALTAAVL
jgi:hypothetical protein